MSNIVVDEYGEWEVFERKNGLSTKILLKPTDLWYDQRYNTRISYDKEIIKADGTDTATMTIEFWDLADNITTFDFIVDGGTPNTVTCVDGVATFQFATNVVGEYTIEATNTNYGSDKIVLKAV